MATPASEVVTLGEAMVVFVPESPGPLRHVERFSRTVAGAEANVAIGLCRLGHSATWVGRVGDDEFGRLVSTTLRGEGVDTRFAQVDPAAPTGVMFKERRPGADSRVLYYRAGSAASRMSPADIPAEAFVGARWLHLTGITPALGAGPRAAVWHALELARRHGLGVSFDPNHRPRLWSAAEARPVLCALASRSDLLLLGRSEGAVLFGSEDPERIAASALAAGARLVAVKLGAAGAILSDAAGSTVIPPLPVAAVEPTGAGDAFAAGCLAALLEGLPAATAGRWGAACGAMVCTATGDWEGMPERLALQALLHP